MSDVTLLTKEIAESLLSFDLEPIEIGEYTAIEDAAAESLGKHRGNLSLDGLTSLSDAAVKIFSKHQGKLLLGWLGFSSDAAAEQFREAVRLNLASTLSGFHSMEEIVNCFGDVKLPSAT